MKSVGSSLLKFRKSTSNQRSFLVVVIKKTWIPVIAKVLREKLGMNCFGGFNLGEDRIALNFVEKPEIIDKLIGMFATVPNCIMIDNRGTI